MRNYISSLFQLRLPRVMTSLAITLLAVAWPSHAAYEVAPHRQPNKEQQLREDARDGQLDQHSLVEAALIASGTVEPSSLGETLERFEAVSHQLRNFLAGTVSDRDKAIAIHAFLHEQVLRTYRTDASDVAETLKTGAYNCVSASVLYIALAEQSGLKAHAVQLPEHVRCEVLVDGIAMPIETTSINASAGRPQRKRVRVLNDVMLIATLYYNRGVAAFDTGNLDAAIDLNEVAVELDADCRPARENLLAAINNRVVELMKANAKTDALRLLDHGLQIAPKYRPFQVNRAYLTQQSP